MTSPSPEPLKKFTGKEFTGKKALFWFIGFFLVIFLVNGIMTYIALGTWGGLDTTDAYRKGLHYNENIAAAEAQHKSGWKIHLSHSPLTIQQDRIDVMITHPKQDLPPARVSVQISRAVTNAYDQELILTKAEDNLYTGPITLPEAGQWNLQVLVKRAEGPIYQLKEKIFIPAENK